MTLSRDARLQLAEMYSTFLRNYYRDEIGEFAQKYPNDQEALAVEHMDLWGHDSDLADDTLAEAPESLETLAGAIDDTDLPHGVDLSDAKVHYVGLPDDRTMYPGEFSPTDWSGEFIALKGEVRKKSETFPKMTEALFECTRCPGEERHPQPSRMDAELRMPHQCPECERKGMDIDYERSDFIDAQLLSVEIPPEYASGNGEAMDVYLKDENVGACEVGDRVTINGMVRLKNKGSQQNLKTEFDTWLAAHSVEINRSTEKEIDITPEERETIKEYASGKHGDPLTVAAQTLAPQLYGYENIKKALILSMVGGVDVTYPDGDSDRGTIHVLLLADPSTGKSVALDALLKVSPRSVGVSGKGATTAGITAAAVQDDWGESEYSLEAGALVQANGGVCAIDELDDMGKEVRGALLEPMSRQHININKAGINTTLETKTTVVAAGNPEHGRYDKHQPIPQQFGFDSALVSRFDVIFTMSDRPEEESDRELSDHMTRSREAAKKRQKGVKTTEEESETVDTPMPPELLPKWIALARRQEDPLYESEDVRIDLRDHWLNIRSDYDVNDGDSAIPITARQLRGMERFSEASAKLCFREEMESRDVQEAKELVGQSMADVNLTDGGFDSDITETGTSASQRQRIRSVSDMIDELAAEYDDGAPVAEIHERLDMEKSKIDHEIQKLRRQGDIYEPNTEHLRTV